MSCYVCTIVYVMDARELHQFKDESFSLIIDKGKWLLRRSGCSISAYTGCLDCIFCGLDLYESSMRFCSVRTTLSAALHFYTTFVVDCRRFSAFFKTKATVLWYHVSAVRPLLFLIPLAYLSYFWNLTISISDAPPPARVPYLRSAPWAIDTAMACKF